VVTAVTPTMATALTNVTANQGTFLTSAALAPVTGTAVTGVTTTTGTVTGITPGSSNPSLRTIAIDAFDPEQRPSGGPVLLSIPAAAPLTNNSGLIVFY
jgi:hypothetical protein